MNQPNKAQLRPEALRQTPVLTPTLLRDIKGHIKTTVINPVVAPTFIPNDINNQLEIRMDLATSPTVKRLYIYSPETKIWSYIILS